MPVPEVAQDASDPQHRSLLLSMAQSWAVLADSAEKIAVLVDRGHRELPIEARFIGRTVQTAENEIIEVKFQEVDQTEKVLLVERVAASEAG